LVQWFWLPTHLLAFFLGALLCHGTLAGLRPPTRDLTAFYLAIALGGVLGGVFNALVAPAIFDRIAEYPLALVLACLVLPAKIPAANESSRSGTFGGRSISSPLVGEGRVGDEALAPSSTRHPDPPPQGGREIQGSNLQTRVAAPVIRRFGRGEWPD